MKSIIKLNEFAAEIGEWRRGHGFHTPTSLDTEPQRDLMLGKLMLVNTELAEAAEAVRHFDSANFEEELADAFIRLMDITDSTGIDIERVIIDKMEKNKLRPFKHGKLCSL